MTPFLEWFLYTHKNHNLVCLTKHRGRERDCRDWQRDNPKTLSRITPIYWPDKDTHLCGARGRGIVVDEIEMLTEEDIRHIILPLICIHADFSMDPNERVYKRMYNDFSGAPFIYDLSQTDFVKLDGWDYVEYNKNNKIT